MSRLLHPEARLLGVGVEPAGRTEVLGSRALC